MRTQKKVPIRYTVQLRRLRRNPCIKICLRLCLTATGYSGRAPVFWPHEGVLRGPLLEILLRKMNPRHHLVGPAL